MIADINKYFDLIEVRSVRFGILFNIVSIPILLGLVVTNAFLSEISVYIMVPVNVSILFMSILVLGYTVGEYSITKFLQLSKDVFVLYVGISYSSLLIGCIGGLLVGGITGVSLVIAGCGLFVTLPLWYVYHGWQISMSTRYQSAEEFSMSLSESLYERTLADDDALSASELKENSE